MGKRKIFLISVSWWYFPTISNCLEHWWSHYRYETYIDTSCKYIFAAYTQIVMTRIHLPCQLVSANCLPKSLKIYMKTLWLRNKHHEKQRLYIVNLVREGICMFQIKEKLSRIVVKYYQKMDVLVFKVFTDLRGV